MTSSARDNPKIKAHDNPKTKAKRAAQTGTLIGVRLQPNDLTSLDAYIVSHELATRPQAIRAVLSDWLATHGFAERTGQPKPVGPATEVVKQMDQAIDEHKKTRRRP